MELKGKKCKVYKDHDLWPSLGINTGTVMSERPYPRYERVFDYEATFQAYGIDYIELDHSCGSFSTAIVIDKAGTLANVPLDMVEIDLESS